jgi:CheY-like chemotaxis protein
MPSGTNAVHSERVSGPLGREIPVIIASADATPEQASRMIDAGALHYFTKPLDVRQFLATLSQILGGAADTSTTL